MCLDDYLTEKEKTIVSEINRFAQNSASYPQGSKQRTAWDTTAFNYINKYVDGVVRQRYIAEYYRLRTQHENR